MKTIVITGASAGIGRALALEFAKRGYRLGLLGRRVDALASLQQEALASGAAAAMTGQLDVDAIDAVASQLGRFFQELGTVDIFVANAGINAFTHVGKDEVATEARIIQTNVIGAIASIDAAAAHFIQQNHGHIVGVSSLASMIAAPKQAAYCASKAAISMYLRSARVELTRHNIRVTDIQPGFVVTDIMPNISKYPFAIPAVKAAFEMAEAIEKGREEAIVPAFPWRLFKPFFRHIPNSFWKRL
jgi:short-subunit dehydrogenase